jgi:hypothetical protein
MEHTRVRLARMLTLTSGFTLLSLDFHGASQLALSQTKGWLPIS